MKYITKCNQNILFSVMLIVLSYVLYYFICVHQDFLDLEFLKGRVGHFSFMSSNEFVSGLVVLLEPRKYFLYSV